jgi:hypothetical protein
MLGLSNNDYVLVDKSNNQMVRFTNGDVVIYGDKKEAECDSYGNELVTRCTELPIELQMELLKQINN